jgi:aerobic-type carbon monoxide dehydrogenase small subunit (CoxS/CutS family)
MKIEFKVNGAARSVDVEADTPLLWALREELGLTGTKFGCGIAQCGACTVHVDGSALRSCVMPASAVAGKAITTIEGLAATPQARLQQAWVDEQVSQCGYCQSGMLMAAAALLQAKPGPSDKDIDEAMSNLCRCGTYPRVKRAIQRAAGLRAAPV